jgi:hypothetical protein
LVPWLIAAAAASAQPKHAERNLAVVARAPQKWALLIGINEYLHGNDLQFCGRDVSELSARLQQLGFPEDHVLVVHDQAQDRRYLPFGSNVRTQLEILVGRVDAKTGESVSQGLVEHGDSLLIAFSGHGVHFDGTSYLCPADARFERAETLISLEYIYQRLLSCPAEFRIMMIDACRNDPRRQSEKSLVPSSHARAFAQSLEKPPSGILLLNSCAPGQISIEDEKLKHGVFMHFVLTGLAGSADQLKGNRDGRVSLLELYQYVSQETKLHVLRGHGVAQTPALRGSMVGDFEFGQLKPGSNAVAASVSPGPSFSPARITRADLEASANFSFALASYFHDINSAMARKRGGVVLHDYNALVAPKGTQTCQIWRSNDQEYVYVHADGETLGFRASQVRSIIFPSGNGNR